MTYYLFARDKDFAGRAYDLGQTDVLVTLPGATMNGSYAAGSLVRAYHATVQNNGTIRNTGYGVELAGSTLVNNGTILANNSGAKYAVWGTSGPDVIVNTGHIRSEASAAATAAIAIDGGTAVITNHGDIQHAGGLAIGGSGSGVVVLENDGQIVGDVRFTGGASADTIANVGTIAGQVDLGGGDDRLDTSHGLITGTITGGLGNDTITGGDASDIIYGDNASGDTTGGDDALYGGAGDDSLFGGYGNDTIQGNQGNDLLQGNQGDDTLHGGQGDDQLLGGQGNDILNGGVGNDVLTGGLGNDTYVFAQGFGRDTIAGFGGVAGNYDVIRFEAGTFGAFADVQAHEVQQGANVLITLDADSSVLVLNTTTAGLTADHFVFG